MGRFFVWMQAARPKTLPAAAAGVVVGTALAVRDDGGGVFAAFFCLAFALLVQIGTNFANDYYDFMRGADTQKRSGPARVTAEGLVRPYVMRRAALLTFAVAFVAGMPLVWYGGFWMIPVGVACIAAGLAYTAGPWPLAYHGLGDLFVFLFFGIVAVTVTCYVQTGTFGRETLAASFAVGALITNILVVNNERDRQGDALAGKQTLAARFGSAFSHGEYLAMLAIAFGTPFVLWLGNMGAAVLLPVILAPWAVFLFRRFCRLKEGRAYNPVLTQTALLAFAFSFLFSIGIVFS